MCCYTDRRSIVWNTDPQHKAGKVASFELLQLEEGRWKADHKSTHLLSGLHVALGWQDLLSRWYMARGGIIGSGEGLCCGSHDEASLLRVLGEKWGLE